MSLSRLPVVLVQLLMHGLRCNEILKLARCSRSLLSVADAPFGWSHALPLPLKTRMLTPKGLSAEVSPRRRRHMSFSLEWLEASSVMAGDIDALLACSDSIRLIELHIRAVNALRAAQCERIFLHPSMMRNLRVVSVQMRDAAIVRSLWQLPHVHTIQLLRWMSLPPPGAPDEIRGAPTALTSLSVVERPWQPLLPLILLCDRLQHLSVCDPVLFAGEPESWVKLLAAPQLSSLRSLRLNRVFVSDQGVGDSFDRAFAALRDLERLELIVGGTPSPLIASLRHAVKLRWLRLTPFGNYSAIEPQLLELMLASPALQCTVDVTQIRTATGRPAFVNLLQRVAAHPQIGTRLICKQE